MVTRITCRICDFQPLASILSLGDLFISDFIAQGAFNTRRKAPLELVLCDADKGGCGLVQLKHTVPHEMMYRNYWYRSGISKTMTDALHEIVAKGESLVKFSPGDFVLDIGANDGTLLRGYGLQNVNLVGFEPARNLREYASKGTTKIIDDFFSFAAWKKEFGSTKVKVVTAIAMFYDLEDPNTFVADVVKCLDPNGVFIIQMSYLPMMLSENAFDNICHEHLEYYSFFSLENLLRRHGLEVFDVELNEINGGSFRTYIRHVGSEGEKISVFEGARRRIEMLRKQEALLGLNQEEVYEKFEKRVHILKEALCDFVKKEVGKGRKVYVYGASTKGNTLLQFFGLDHHLITAAAERNPDKWGKRTVGTNIPIVSEEEARIARPDYFLVLPWHFIKEFVEREQEFLAGGGKFIVPLPQFAIISRDGISNSFSL